ncbi:hypothetical protein GE115_15970 [Agromyces sp. CFH 90414]|uniref:N-acetyltransferase domain-containing protein n=1 Tax=Agromyces agglutinans TaxID=2662258 RepID=A0A6I2FB01_9MICO|nr:GNAT family N-acetyltransferase [Agromyces agglutinans]MRG61354.1 hypothetical protein [Agromyces agglutinans]
MTLRATRAGEHDALLHIRHRTGSDADTDLRTIRVDGEIIGAVALRRRGGRTDLEIGLAPAHRGRGIEARVLRLLLDTCARPVRTSVAPGDEASLAVFIALGFAAVAEAADAAADEVVLELA